MKWLSFRKTPEFENNDTIYFVVDNIYSVQFYTGILSKTKFFKNACVKLYSLNAFLNQIFNFVHAFQK